MSLSHPQPERAAWDARVLHGHLKKRVLRFRIVRKVREVALGQVPHAGGGSIPFAPALLHCPCVGQPVYLASAGVAQTLPYHALLKK